jgi:hypothetical protein
MIEIEESPNNKKLIVTYPRNNVVGLVLASIAGGTILLWLALNFGAGNPFTILFAFSLTCVFCSTVMVVRTQIVVTREMIGERIFRSRIIEIPSTVRVEKIGPTVCILSENGRFRYCLPRGLTHCDDLEKELRTLFH